MMKRRKQTELRSKATSIQAATTHPNKRATRPYTSHREESPPPACVLLSGRLQGFRSRCCPVPR